LPFDVTDPGDVDRALAEAARLTGGVDLLVLSHGIAEVADIDALDPARLERVFRVNALGSFHVLGGFVRQVRAGGGGGDVVLVSTKNVPDPGASFSAYSASKAAAHQLARVAAIELAPHDIRVNMVAPDAVFGDDEIPSALWQEVGAARARSRGIDPAELPERYRRRNLLQARVTVEDVARAVLFFARRATPTTGAVLPVDGGLPGAFPR
ncbi:MAG: SDR family oxidoreductase, partial [Acidobacteria bacterium]